MLLRVYRVTDKLGLVILKISEFAMDWLGSGAYQSRKGIAHVFSAALSRVFMAIRGVLQLLLGLVLVFSSVLRAIGSRLWRILIFVMSLFGVAIGQTGGAISGVSSSASQAMARRAARDEIDVTFKEDPLRVQNRRLSFLVLILGVIAVTAVLWATDPNRNPDGLPVANTNPDGISNPILNPISSVTPDSASSIIDLPTPIPTATPIPDALIVRGSLAFTVREQAQTDLWAMNVGSNARIRITNDVADERDPEWNPDGTRLAYASRQDGNWELYIYDLATQQTSRVSFDLAFQANPTWSPDSLWLAYENYQGENLDIFAVPIDASSPPTPITSHPAPDYSPAWSPSGRAIAFVSLREGNQDIYVINLDDRSITNVTNTPLINEDHPAWSLDGRRIAFSARDQGAETIFIKNVDDLATPAEVVGFGRTPSWSPDGSSLVYAVDSLDGTRTYLSAMTYGEGGVPTQVIGLPFGATAPTWSIESLPPQLVNSGGLPLGNPEPLYVENLGTLEDGIYQLRSLGDVQTTQPLLSDAVNDSFDELRKHIAEETGVDFLDQLDDAFWRLEDRPEPGEPRRNWYMTGRGFAIARNKILGVPPPIEIVREQQGINTLWRVYVRVDEESQSGQLGEPLRHLPWDFLAATQGDVEAFNQGGRLRREVRPGYYVDFTQLADDYGWIPQPAGTDWRANERSRNYWLFVKNEGLTWCDAMHEIYLPTQIANFECETG